MGIYVFVILLTAVMFLAIILLLAAKPRFASRMTGIFIVIAAVGGLFFYGCGFAATIDNFPLAVIRALLGVCGMFVAKMDISSISAAPFMQNEWAHLAFWIVHMLALYATASAAITTVGAQALRKLRLWLARWGQLNLIYGVNEASVSLGKELLTQKNCTVVFIDGKPDASLAATIASAGCVLRSDENALNGTEKFIRSIGLRSGKRRVTLYALQKDASDSMRYARHLLASLEACSVTPEQTSLVLRAREDSTGGTLQALGNRYGFGSVTVIQEAGLAARLLIRNYPPCSSISFDENACATENFEALIVGFGQVGQAVLRNLVMHGQFAGSKFRAAVFSPDCLNIKGYFSKSFDQVLKHYDIEFHPCDARSEQMYDYLAERGRHIKYIAICTGSDKLNHEIAEDMLSYFGKTGLTLPVYLCSHQGVTAFSANGQTAKTHKLYTPAILSVTGLDKMAMILNHHYQKDSDRTELENWMHCDYFSRMSCRASTDFMQAMVRMSGYTEEQILENGFTLTEQQLENMSRTEHDRWCAFHYCMGFTPMSSEEYGARAEIYRKELAAGQAPSIRIGKNMIDRTHACLIDWNKLDELSRRETEITGKPVDYKAMDRDNVLAVPELLRTHRESGV